MQYPDGALKWVWRTGLAVVLIVLGVPSFLVAATWTASGQKAEGQRLERIKRSPQWKGDRFDNELARVDGGLDQMLSRFLEDNPGRSPAAPIEIERRRREDFSVPPPSGLRVTWLGHSTFIIEIDGSRVLIDPVWGERASPLSWAGPKRFHEPPLPLNELPPIDAVVISHDHYDHLDHPTISQMQRVDTRWLVPLGVGAHLEYWGIDPSRIEELDWWESRELGPLTITCAPARHFSGRSLTSMNATLWSGWALAGPEHRVFYSGDTALHPAFEDISEQLGPFDLSIIETGAYSPMWSDVHLGPEQALIAHAMLEAKLLLPAHWGTFDLALHPWVEPIQRIRRAALESGAKIVAPRPGGQVEIDEDVLAMGWVDEWWDSAQGWATVEERPAWSTGVDELLERSVLYR